MIDTKKTTDSKKTTDTKKTTNYELAIEEYEDWDSGEVPWDLKDVNVTTLKIKVNFTKNTSKYF
jgi:hypothetical protein